MRAMSQRRRRTTKSNESAVVLEGFSGRCRASRFECSDGGGNVVHDPVPKAGHGRGIGIVTRNHKGFGFRWEAFPRELRRYILTTFNSKGFAQLRWRQSATLLNIRGCELKRGCWGQRIVSVVGKRSGSRHSIRSAGDVVRRDRGGASTGFRCKGKLAVLRLASAARKSLLCTTLQRRLHSTYQQASAYR